MRYLLSAAVVASVVLLDQAAKLWAGRTLAGGPPVTVIDGFFRLVYHRNTGGVFGLFAGPASDTRRLFFVAATVAALAFVVYLLRQWGGQSRTSLVGLSLVAGGAVGNLIDRIAYGEVVDFIDWYWGSYHWPTFNIADSAITAGTALLLFSVVCAPPKDTGNERG